MGSGQELGRQIGDDLDGELRVRDRFERLDVAMQHAIADGIGERHAPVRCVAMLGQLGLKTVQVLDRAPGRSPPH